MAENIRLKVSKDRVNWFDLILDNTKIPITISVQDIANFSKRNGSVSKTITIANNKDNHKNIELLYETKSFDFIKKRIHCQLIKDDAIVFDNLNLTILSYDRKIINGEEIVTYNARVFDNLTDFYKRIDKKTIKELDFSEYSHIYNSTTIKNSFTNTYVDGYKYHLKYLVNNNGTNSNVYNTEDMQPAMYIRNIFDKIHDNAGYRYEFSQMDDRNIRLGELLMPFTGDLKKIIEEDGYLEEFKGETIFLPNWAMVETKNQSKTATKKVDMDSTTNPVVYDVPNSVYVSPGTFSGNNVVFDIYLKGTLDLTNYSVQNVSNWWSVPNVPSKATGKKITPYIEIYNQTTNQVLQRKVLNLHNIPDTDNNGAKLPQVDYNNGEYEIAGPINFNAMQTRTLGEIDGVVSMSVPVNHLDKLAFRLYLKYNDPNGQSNTAFRNNAQGTFYPYMRYVIDITEMNINVDYNIESFFVGSTVNMNYYLPEIKQNEFMDSIMKYCNLYCEIYPDDPFKIIYKTRDKFYDDGNHKGDYTHLVDFSKGLNSVFIPDIQQKRTRLQYKDDSSDPAIKEYKNKTENIPAEQIIIFDNDNVKGEKTVKTIFAPTFNADTDFNANVPLYPHKKKAEIKLLLDNDVLSCDNYTIQDNTNTNQYTLTQYPFVSMQDKPYNPTFSIEYAPSDYYLYNNYYTFNNLFNNHFVRMFTQMNSSEIITCYMNLNSILPNTLMSDRFIIENRLYYFNKIIDYLPDEAYTKVELITADVDSITPQFINSRLPDKNGGIKVVHVEDDVIINVKNTLGTLLDTQTYNNVSYPVTVDIENTLLTPLVADSIVGGVDDITVRYRTKPTMSTEQIIISNHNDYNKERNSFDPSIISLGTNNKVLNDAKNIIMVGDDWIVDEPNTIYTKNLIVENIITPIKEVTREEYLEAPPKTDEIVYITDRDLYHFGNKFYREIDIVDYMIIYMNDAYKYDYEVDYVEDDIVVYCNRYYRRIDNAPIADIIKDGWTDTLPALYYEEVDLGYRKKTLEIGYDIFFDNYVYVKDFIQNNIIVNPNMNSIEYMDWADITIKNNVFGAFQNIITTDCFNNVIEGDFRNIKVPTIVNNTFDSVIKCNIIYTMRNNRGNSISTINCYQVIENNFHAMSNIDITGDIAFNIMTGNIIGVNSIDDIIHNRCNSITGNTSAVSGVISDPLTDK